MWLRLREEALAASREGHAPTLAGEERRPHRLGQPAEYTPNVEVTRSHGGKRIHATIDPPLWLGFTGLDIHREGAAAITLSRHVAPGTTNERLARAVFRRLYAGMAALPPSWRVRLSDRSIELISTDRNADADAAEAGARSLAAGLSELSAASAGAWRRTLVDAWREAAATLGARFDEGALTLRYGERRTCVEVRVELSQSCFQTWIVLGATPPPDGFVPLPAALDALGFSSRSEAERWVLSRDGLVADSRAIADALRAAVAFVDARAGSEPYR